MLCAAIFCRVPRQDTRQICHSLSCACPRGTRQRWHYLPCAWDRAHGKGFVFAVCQAVTAHCKQVVPRAVGHCTLFCRRPNIAHGKVFAVCPRCSTRQTSYLPAVVCRELFAVCKPAFVVCLWHMANVAHPVVFIDYSKDSCKSSRFCS